MSRFKRDKEIQRPDKRKIPKLFRAVEKDENSPMIFHGYLVGDDGTNFISYSVREGTETSLIERVLEKRRFSFYSISNDEFELNGLRGIRNMEHESTNAQMEADAKKFALDFAITKFEDLKK